MAKNVLERLAHGIGDLTDAQKRVADYILKYPSEVAFMTIEKLAKNSRASVATIMRLAYAQNFDGYSDMQRELKDIVLLQVTPASRLSVSAKKITNNKLLLQCAEMQIDNIRNTVSFMSDEAAKQGVAMLLKARKIYTIGIRSSKSVAIYLDEGLNRIGIDCELLLPDTSRLLRQLALMDEHSLVIPVSFPRYIKKTYEIANAAKMRKAKILALTDGHSSPLAGIADLFIPCAYATLSFHSSTLGAIFAADYLLTAAALHDSRRSQKSLDAIEDFAQTFNPTLLK